MNQLFASLFEQSTSKACLVDVTGPTFAGITSAVAQINGSVNVGWSAATDATTPLTYAVYVKAGSAPNPGTDTPAVLTRALSAKVYVDGLQALLVKGTTYYFLVRAIDAVGNQDSNLISMTAISAGVLTDDLAAIAASLAATEILLAADHVNFVADDAAFDADHANFVADHAAFVSDQGALTDAVDAIVETELLLRYDHSCVIDAEILDDSLSGEIDSTDISGEVVDSIELDGEVVVELEIKTC